MELTSLAMRLAAIKGGQIAFAQRRLNAVDFIRDIVRWAFMFADSMGARNAHAFGRHLPHFVAHDVRDDRIYVF